MIHRLNAIGTSFFGSGALQLLPDEIKKRNYKRALIITDEFLFHQGVAEEVGKYLLKGNAEYAIFYHVVPNPTVSVVMECTEGALSIDADFIVAVGGGSAIDTAKAAGILITNGGRIEDYEGINKSTRGSLPIIAVNTTAGTGSEVTSFYVISNEMTQSKMVMVDVHCLVSIGINDTDLMISMPKALTAATGMDAMTHSIEAVMSKEANPYTDKDALWAITQIKRNLLTAYQDGENREAREMMAYAQYSAGMAFSNSGLGLVHAMAHSLGGFYNLPHGICNSILLPYIMEFNGRDEKSLSRFKLIGEALEIKGMEAMSDEKIKNEVILFIKKFSTQLGIPKSFKELGVKKEDFDSLTNLVMMDTCLPSNPVTPTREQVLELFYQAIK